MEGTIAIYNIRDRGNWNMTEQSDAMASIKGKQQNITWRRKDCISRRFVLQMGRSRGCEPAEGLFLCSRERLYRGNDLYAGYTRLSITLQTLTRERSFGSTS